MMPTCGRSEQVNGILQKTALQRLAAYTDCDQFQPQSPQPTYSPEEGENEDLTQFAPLGFVFRINAFQISLRFHSQISGRAFTRAVSQGYP